jgi:hypothetical protein
MGYRRLIDCDQLFEDDQLFEAIGTDGVMLYVRLWSLAECWGGLEDNPKSISRQSGALNLSSKKVGGILKKLVELDKIFPYELEGKRYLWLKNLPKHQKLSRSPKSKIPIPNWIHAEPHEYDSKTSWTYTVLEDLAPSNSMLPDSRQYATGQSAEFTKQSSTKQNKAVQGADHRQTTPEQAKPVPLTGDNSFYNFLKRFSLKTCLHCHGTGLNVNKDPCLCVREFFETAAREILEDSYETLIKRVDPNCSKCLGYGVIFSGDRDNAKVKQQCDCGKPKVKSMVFPPQPGFSAFL